MTTSIIKRSNGTTNTPAKNVSSWMDQLLQDNLNRFFNDDFWGFNGLNQQVSVPVNLRETDKSYEMSIVAPGLHKEDFKLNVTNDLLTVSYEHKDEKNEKEKPDGWLRTEYRMQSFSRSFTLDDTVDVNKITASYNNGILHLTLPKKDTAQRLSRTIEIK
ncbi:MAG: Hsp20/alpha crystallin family protein [Sphingobacteriales bacterium]|nr:MAG: Hsp20/alpha crystallin family protein [Sphingobacteriales bacterium]